jgi:hypothetical protein
MRNRMVLWIGLAAGLAPGLAQADAWERLDGPAVATALGGQVLAYPDGTQQSFLADGGTVYGESRGQWEVRGDQYCSVWPPSDRWACYDVDRQGQDIRFTDDAGNATLGRFVDAP